MILVSRDESQHMRIPPTVSRKRYPRTEQVRFSFRPNKPLELLADTAFALEEGETLSLVAVADLSPDIVENELRKHRTSMLV
jgi:hypothetical protein